MKKPIERDSYLLLCARRTSVVGMGGGLVVFPNHGAIWFDDELQAIDDRINYHQGIPIWLPPLFSGRGKDHSNQVFDGVHGILLTQRIVLY
jgi:hypothetical protein